jgi:lipoyl(octanoyl) transferase
LVRTALISGLHRDEPVEWARSDGLIDYAAAVAAMEARAAAVRDGAPELVWLLEHPPLYTAGTSAKARDLIDVGRFPVHRSSRGGEFTYHGPGQRVAYAMLDLASRGRDVRGFVGGLEAWIIAALARLGVRGEVRDDRVGVWVARTGAHEDKIAAIGVRIRRWVSFHGLALNVAPDLAHFSGIVPCGVAAPQLGVTSLKDLGVAADMAAADRALRAAFEEIFAPTVAAPPPVETGPGL